MTDRSKRRYVRRRNTNLLVARAASGLSSTHLPTSALPLFVDRSSTATAPLFFSSPPTRPALSPASSSSDDVSESLTKTRLPLRPVDGGGLLEAGVCTLHPLGVAKLETGKGELRPTASSRRVGPPSSPPAGTTTSRAFAGDFSGADVFLEGNVAVIEAPGGETTPLLQEANLEPGHAGEGDG